MPRVRKAVKRKTNIRKVPKRIPRGKRTQKQGGSKYEKRERKVQQQKIAT